jgi:hypothetical protein
MRAFHSLGVLRGSGSIPVAESPLDLEEKVLRRE